MNRGVFQSLDRNSRDKLACRTRCGIDCRATKLSTCHNSKPDDANHSALKAHNDSGPKVDNNVRKRIHQPLRVRTAYELVRGGVDPNLDVSVARKM